MHSDPMSPAMQRAWLAYYTTLRDDPEATADERQRGKDMLKKAPLIKIRDLPALNPEDFG